MKSFLLIIALMSVGFSAKSQIGINIDTPHSSAMLHIESEDKGFLPPRTTLLNANDGVTIHQPATGLTVYNRGGILPAGLYTNVGTPQKPIWTRGPEKTATDDFGTKTYKAKFTGRNTSATPKPMMKIPEMNLEVRFFEDVEASGFDRGNHYFQIRLINPPSASTTEVKLSGHWHGKNHSYNNQTISFTSADYNKWQDLHGGSYAGSQYWNGWWSFLYYVATSDSAYSNFSANIYGLCMYQAYGYGINNSEKEQYVIAGELF